MQADPVEYRQLDLRAHAFLADVDLHDVWIAELHGGVSDERTIEDVRRCMTVESVTAASLPVRILFAVRAGLGSLFGWDRDIDRWADESYRHRLSEEDRERSLLAPGSIDGPFRIVYVYPYEALSEIRNATVHAFSCMAMRPTLDGYRLYWAIYVKPIGRFTGAYMRLIDPFRKVVVYPAIIRRLERSWRATFDSPA